MTYDNYIEYTNTITWNTLRKTFFCIDCHNLPQEKKLSETQFSFNIYRLLEILFLRFEDVFKNIFTSFVMADLQGAVSFRAGRDGQVDGHAACWYAANANTGRQRLCGDGQVNGHAACWYADRLMSLCVLELKSCFRATHSRPATSLILQTYIDNSI